MHTTSHPLRAPLAFRKLVPYYAALALFALHVHGLVWLVGALCTPLRILCGLPWQPERRLCSANARALFTLSLRNWIVRNVAPSELFGRFDRAIMG